MQHGGWSIREAQLRTQGYEPKLRPREPRTIDGLGVLDVISVAADGAPAARERGRHPTEGRGPEPDARRSRRSTRAKRPKLSVLVSSDDPFTRRAFSSGATAPDIVVIAKANLTDAVETLVEELEPDIVVLDVQVAASRALGTIQQLHEQAPATRILACDAPTGIEFGLLCLIAGAWGYVSKEIDLAALPRLVRSLAHGEAVIPRPLATELAQRFVSSTHRAPAPAGRKLSRPESQVLELLRGGLTLAEAADELDIGVATAQRHLGSARRKLSTDRSLLAGEFLRITETTDQEVHS